MANPTRFPTLFGEPFEDVFNRMLRPMRWEGETAPPQIKVDVSENETAYTVKAEVPGVTKDDIHVQIDGNIVTIAAEVKKEEDEKRDGRVIRSERYYGSMQRAFSLGTDVDESKAEAKYENGVLRLTLPKREGGRARRLTVS